MTAQGLVKNKRLLVLIIIFFLLSIFALWFILIFKNKHDTNLITTINTPTKSASKKATASAQTAASTQTTAPTIPTNKSSGGNKSTNTNNQTPPPPFAVITASVSVSPASYQFWDCDTSTFTFTFTGSITANGAGDVTYYWVRQTDPAMLFRPLGSKTVHFSAAGTQLVTLDWPWTGTNSLSTPPADNNPWTYTGTATLHITLPNAFVPTPSSASYTITDPRCVP